MTLPIKNNRDAPAVYGDAPGDALTDVAGILDAARSAAARSVNSVMTAAYWLVGHRIVEYEQGGAERAEYGSELIRRLSVDLTARYGRGFSPRNLRQMRAFCLGWPIRQTASGESAPVETRIWQTASAKRVSQEIALSALAPHFPLPWSGYVRLLSVSNESAREFYEAEALAGGWNTTVLADGLRIRLRAPTGTRRRQGESFHMRQP